VARLETPLANDEFTRNAEVMQARVKALVSLNARLAADDANEAERAAMREQVKSLQTKIAADNQRMVDAYRYSLTHQYVRDIEHATVYLLLSDDEVAAIRSKAAAEGKATPASLDTNQISICTLPTPEAARAFQADVATLQAERAKAVEFQAQMEQAQTEEARAYAKGQFDQIMKQINTLNRAMVGTYGFSLNRNYVLQIDKSSLYVWADEDVVGPGSTADASESGR